MYIREAKTRNKKTGALYVTHKLVESYQTEKGPRQRLVMSLGKLSVPKKFWKSLSKIIEAKLSGQEYIFRDEELEEIAEKNIREYYDKRRRKNSESNPDFANIDLSTVDVLQSRSMGPELIGHHFWERLRFKHILSKLGFRPKEIDSAKEIILGRLIEPASENATVEWLKNRTALTELRQRENRGVDKNDIYEIGDLLLQHKEEIEKQLSGTKTDLFQENSKLFLYDLTNFHLEGQAKNNELAKYGKSKQKRNDCPLVTLALAVDEDGFPLFSEIYEGNKSEPETLEDILNKIKNKNPFLLNQTLTLVMDRGIATKANLALMVKRGFHYVIIERADISKEYVSEFENYKDNFELMQSEAELSEKIYFHSTQQTRQVEYREENEKLVSQEIAVTRVLTVSEGRKSKERAIDEKKEKNFLYDMNRIIKSNKKGNIKLIAKVYERIGRLKQKYPSIAGCYAIKTKENDKNTEVISITCVKKEKMKEKNTLNGCYVIETNKAGLNAEAIWKLYMRLAKVENAFKSMKSQLGTRPIFHQTALRTKAHLFISVLAYTILISIEHSLKKSKDHRTWKTIRTVLSTHRYSTVTMKDDKKNIYHICVSNTSDSSHLKIYEELQIKNPLKRKKYIVSKRL